VFLARVKNERQIMTNICIETILGRSTMLIITAYNVSVYRNKLHKLMNDRKSEILLKLCICFRYILVII